MNNEFKIKINGNEYNININNVEGNVANVEVNGMPYNVEVEGALSNPAARAKVKSAVAKQSPAKLAAPVVAISKPAASAGSGAIKSPLPGVIIEVNVKVGDEVKSGQKVLVLEAMKMENNINADRDGKVIEIKANKGDSVLEGDDLIVIG